MPDANYLQGYANEELASITFDVTNASGTVSNQMGFMKGAVFDTNRFADVTDYFQCYDLSLTNGTNRVTLHAVDLAGNVTTTNFVFNLNYATKTNPPVVQIYWPTNGTQIGANSFTMRGWLDDFTVSVSAQITDTNGDTNTVAGVVERNGNFWVDNIPLAAGTNFLTLTATDAAGNVTTTNLNVVQSSVVMTINPTNIIMRQALANFTGTMNTAGYKVWVNGVVATQSGTAPSISWTATNVPVNGVGTAVFEALAITNTDNSGNGTGGGGGTNSSLNNPGNPTPADAASPRLSADPDKKSCIICQTFSATLDWRWVDASGLVNDHFNSVNFAYGSTGTSLSTEYQSYWADGGIGFGAVTAEWDQYGYGDITNYSALGDNDYSAPEEAEAGELIEIMSGPTFEAGDLPWLASLAAQGEESDYNITTGGWSDEDFIYDDFFPTNAILTTQRKVASTYSLLTGGKAASQRMAVFELTTTASKIIHLGDFNYSPTPVAVPYNQITVMGQTLDANNTTYIVEPDGITVPLAVDVGGSSSASSGVSAAVQKSGSASFIFYPAETKHRVFIRANGTELDPDEVLPNANYVVGQYVTFTIDFDPEFTENYLDIVSPPDGWAFGGKYYNEIIPGQGEASTRYSVSHSMLQSPITWAWWVSGGDPKFQKAEIPTTYSASTTQTLLFQNRAFNVQVTGQFNMYCPVATITPNPGTVGIILGGGGKAALDCGKNNMPGMTFKNTITYPPNFIGDDFWVQVVTGTTRKIIDTSNVQHLLVQSPTVGPWLDTAVPYPFKAPDGVSPVDFPFLKVTAADASCSANDSFQMTMMFTPPGPGVPVPIIALPWSWNGKLAKDPTLGWMNIPSNNQITSQPPIDKPDYPAWNGYVSIDNFQPPIQ